MGGLTPNNNPDWPPPTDDERNRGYECFTRTNWDAIRSIASRTNNGQPCRLSAHYRAGGNFLVRQIVFEDGSCWIARVQLRGSTTVETSQRLRFEIDTTILLSTRTQAVARVFPFELDDTGVPRDAFVLMSFIPGKTVTEEAGGFEWNLVPADVRHTLYATMAPIHVEIASARLSKIGTVCRQEDGTFIAGPIPGLGGPFNTAASFIQAWASRTIFPSPDKGLQQGLNGLSRSLVDEVLEGISSFPARLARLASSGRYFTKQGPFPIRHADLFHNNLIVDEAYRVQGVIDWEGSYTVPWELVDAPCFLTTVPRLLNPPEQYDEGGNPLDPEEGQKWKDENTYAELVRVAEVEAGADDKLSCTLGDQNARNLAALVHLYDQGKLGFYGRALEYFENR